MAHNRDRQEKDVNRNWIKWSLTVLTLCAAAFTFQAFAHTEFDLCTPESGMDLSICRQIADADAAPPPQNLAMDREAGDREAGVPQPPLKVGVEYVGVGVGHILPGGTDHILFVLALFLGASGWRQLGWHISLFTLAHTATLGLAAASVINPPASVVEPIIAASIALVAIENIVWPNSRWWRPFVIFGFGLVHGMGFAGFFGELGLPVGQFWYGLIGFNVGVEIGQLSVVFAAGGLAVLVRPWLSELGRTYRDTIVIPGSLAIGAVGLWWTIERVLGG